MRKRDYITAACMVAGFAFAFSAFNSPQAAQALTGDPLTNTSYSQQMYQFFTSTGKFTNPDQLAIPGLEADGLSLGMLSAEGVLLAPTLPELVATGLTVYIGYKVVTGISNQVWHLQHSLGAVPTAANIAKNDLCPENSNQACAGGSTGHQPANCFCAGLPATDPFFIANNGAFMQWGFGFASGICTAIGGSGAWNTTVASGASNFSVVIVPTSQPIGGNQTANGSTCLTSALQALNAKSTEMGSQVTTVSVPNSEMNSGSLACGDWAATAVYAGSGTCPAYNGGYVALVETESQLETQFVHGMPCVTTETGCVTTGDPITATKTLSPALTGTPDPNVVSRGATTVLGNSSPDIPGYLRCLVDPAEYSCPNTTTAPQDFTIPQPQPNETYNDYSARLRALGYLGAIIFLDDPGYDGVPGDAFNPDTPGLKLDPGTVTGVGVGTGLGAVVPLFWPNTGSTIPGFDPTKAPGTVKQWQPTTAPTIHPLTTPSIVLAKVPDAYAPPSSSTTPTPGAPNPAPGTGQCKLPTIPAVDFTPLTGITFGNQFPFGVFAWVTTVFGWFDVSAVAPSWDFDMSGMSTFVPGFSAHYAGNLNAFNPYMNAVRTIIAFALWIGAIWYVGTSLIGFKSGGDLTEAADD